MTRILVTGNMGYVGPVLVRHLRRVLPNAKLLGFDSAFFGHCLTSRRDYPERLLDAQHYGDVREFPPDLLDGVDVVVHLAAVSNDPMGNRFEAVTEEINRRASVRLAEIARDKGVRSFVFASSCSIYGAAESGARSEDASVNPLTAYARSKVATENALAAMPLGEMTVTALRFGTACGVSDRLRLDLVLNDFVACATTSGDITVLSDGSPWRPLIDVKDMARAIEWAASRTQDKGGQVLRVNTGSDDWNYQVKDLAYAVAERIPGTTVTINAAAPQDKRSYRVDFGLFADLAPEHVPRMRLKDVIDELAQALHEMSFDDPDFRDSDYMRLKVLERHIDSGRLGKDLRWMDR